MHLAVILLVGAIAALHVYFLVLEMFLWTRPYGLRLFRQSLEKARETAVLAANQGLYNGFLAAGLLWGLLQPDPGFSAQIEGFFLGCVVAAGIYGGISFSKRIFFTQGLPAAVALALLLGQGW
jgi:putative membrane protein